MQSSGLTWKKDILLYLHEFIDCQQNLRYAGCGNVIIFWFCKIYFTVHTFPQCVEDEMTGAHRISHLRIMYRSRHFGCIRKHVKFTHTSGITSSHMSRACIQAVAPSTLLGMTLHSNWYTWTWGSFTKLKFLDQLRSKFTQRKTWTGSSHMLIVIGWRLPPEHMEYMRNSTHFAYFSCKKITEYKRIVFPADAAPHPCKKNWLASCTFTQKLLKCQNRWLTEGSVCTLSNSLNVWR